MKQQFKIRLFSFVSILSLLSGALGIPTQSALAANAGMALQFDGTNDYVTFGPEPSNLGAQQFTLEAWFKWTGGGSTTATSGSTGGGLLSVIPLISKGRGEADGTNADMNYILGIQGGKLAADFEECNPVTQAPDCPAGGTAGLNHSIVGNTTITTNVWHHAAVTYDGQTWNIYLDGVLDGTLTLAAPRYPRWDSIQHAGLATAMTSTGAAAGFFAGIIDEARIWNVARTQAEIQADMYGELTSGTGLIGRWGLNDGLGTTATNSIAGSPNGTLTNGPTWVAGFPIPDSDPPAAPSGLSATAGNTVIALAWTANSEPDVSGYNVYRSAVSGGPYTKINGSLIGGTSYADYNLSNGTTYYYVITAVDSSSNESTYSSEVNGTPSNIESALQFDGTNDYVTFGPNLNATSFTLETWVKRDTGGATMTTGSNGFDGQNGRPFIYPVLTKGMGEGETPANINMNWFLGITSTGVIGADFEDNAGGVNHPAWGTTVVSIGEWHHIAATYDGSCWALYLDGNLETLNGAVTACPNATPEFNSIQHAGLSAGIGSTGQLSSGFFAGTIDEARVWNIARTQAEIQAGRALEITSAPGLIGRWGLDEGAGQFAFGSMGGINGSLMNGPTWAADGFPIPDTTPPAAPTGLSSTPFSSNVNLTWTANTEPDLGGYNLYRGTTAGGPYTKVNSSLIISTSYTDGGLTNGTPYYYVVRAVDTSGNESTDSNETSATPLESLGAALNLGSGSAHVTFGDPAALDLAQFTIETWFIRTGPGVSNTTGGGGITNAIPLVTHGSPEADGSNVDANWILAIDDTNDVIAADFEDAVSGLNHPVYGTTTVTNNVWHHVAATYDGTAWRLYLDGNLETTLVVNAVPRSDSIQQSALGAMIESNGVVHGHFEGALDEVRIWDYARTQSQIQSTINAQISTAQTGLVARWGLDEGTGALINSSAGTSVSGTINNAGYFWTPGAPFNISFTPPAAPSDLNASASSANNVNLAWTDNSSNEANFEIERGNDLAGPFSPLTNVGANTTAYEDATVLPLTQYCYRVRATNAGGASDYSNISCTTTPTESDFALDFGSSNAYVTFGDAAALRLPEFTLEGWFKREGPGATANTGAGGFLGIPLITKGVGEAEGTSVDMNYFLGIHGTNNVICADFEEGPGGAGPLGQNHPVCGTTVIANNTWYHVAATYDGDTWRIYLNGNPEATLAVNQPVRSDSIQHAGLGVALNSTGTASGHFDGVLDEVRIWNYARSRAQILSTINSQVSAPQTGLVGRWSLNEGSGTMVHGSAGTTVNGTVTGTGSSWITPGAPFNIVIDTTPPSAPTNLMASPRPGAVQLEWTVNTEPDLAGYNVYRSTTSPVIIGTPVNSALLVSPAYLDTNVTAGTQYYFAVTAVDTSNNESVLSNEAGAIPLPPPPPEALDLGSNRAYVALGDNADTAQFTLETWLRRDGTGTATSTGSGGVDLIPLITNGTAEAENVNADINYFFGIRGTDGVLCADFEEAQTGAAPSQNHPVCGVTPLQNNTWYHVAATYDGTTMRLYLNGNLDKAQTIGQPANAANTSQLAFGTSLTTANTALGFFDGVLDEVRIWNLARTQAEIVSTINSRIETPQPGLIGRWGLDEGSGSLVTDSSGNGINGTITGTGYSWVPGSPFNVTVNLPPEAPILVEPMNGASNVPVPATLSVNVSDPENEPLNVTFYGRPLQGAAGPDFTIIAIPDPQYYASTYPSIYNAQMQWIVDNKINNNIVYVASLGDNVDVASDINQWTNADTAWSILEAGNVPYGLEAGNHDGAPSGTGNFNVYFGESRFTGRSYYGGHYGGDNDNHYDLFETSGLRFIVIFIEYDDGMTSTSHPVLQWANDLLQTHSDRRGIVVTHNLLQGGTSGNFTTQGQTIYSALKANPNLFLLLGGHLDVAGRRTDTFNGNTIYSLRSDYQTVDNRQSGYLRIMRFSPADDMIYVTTYSPTQNKIYDKSDAAQNNFNLSYVMDGTGFEVIGTATGVASGTTASIEWAGLAPNEQYEWYVIASDGTHQTPSETWSFTTAPPAPTCYMLTLSHSGQGSDPIASPANSTGCPAGRYVAGESISLSGAVPDAGWQISGWTGTDDDASTASTNTVTMPAGDHTAGVIYTEIMLTLEYAAGPGGTLTGNTSQVVAYGGSGTAVTAVPDTGYQFVGWSDGSTANPRTDTNVTANISVIANFTQITHNLTIAVEPAGGGTTDPAVGVHTYPEGAVVNVSAVPNSGYVFDHWSGACTGGGVCQVTMDADKMVTAIFMGSNEVTVTFQNDVAGYTGTVDTHIMEAEPATDHGALESIEWDADDPPGTGQDKYALIRFDNIFGSGPGQIPLGATIQSATLRFDVFNTGNPADLSEVTVDWTESETWNSFGGDPGVQPDEYGASLGSTNGDSMGSRSVDVTASLVAWSNNPSMNKGWIFRPTGTDGVDFRSSEYALVAGRPSLEVTYLPGSPAEQFNLTVNTVGNGSVTLSPAGGTYDVGTVVQLTAVADSGWTFAGWSGDLSGSNNPGSITMDGHKTVTATFIQITYMLDVTITGNGTVTKNPDQPAYLPGTIVELAAVPANGWTFAGWSGDLSGMLNPISITMDGNKSVAATFTSAANVIFADGFESGDLSRWSSCVTDGGDLSVGADAKYAGNSGMRAIIDDNIAIYCTSDHPNAESRYLASFYFDPNSIAMASGDTHLIFGGYSGTSTLVLRVQFRKASGNYLVRASVRNDGSTWKDSGWFSISDAYHQIQLDWRAATTPGANNGGLTLWIDGVQLADLTGVDNDTRRIDRARLGAVNEIDTGTRGTYYFDEFESSRGEMGPVVVTADFSADPTAGATPLAVSFTNLSQPTANITGYLWDFGDGTTSTETNPVHTYTAAGDYTVMLTAFGVSQQDTETKTNYIHVTAPSADIIFADGFESCDLSAWSSSITDGGDLSASAASALAGSCGMQALIDNNTSIYVSDDSPSAEPRYRARFYFDPNSISMVNGDAHFIFNGLMGSSTAVLRVEFRRSSGAYQIRGRLLNDGSSWTNTDWFTISDAPHVIELDWRAASAAGANDGGLTLWIDGVQKANLTTVDNDTRRIDRVRLGAVAGIDTGTRGTYYFDAFESRRLNYIGP